MNFYSIKSARYTTASIAPDAPVVVTRTSGAIEYRRANDDIEGGGMLAFLADGGIIDDYIPEPVAQVVPPVISDRQFGQALADKGVITRPEAIAFVKTGTVPAALQLAIDAIEDEDVRFAVDMQVSGATQFERNNSTTQMLADALGWDSKNMDELWIYAAVL